MKRHLLSKHELLIIKIANVYVGGKNNNFVTVGLLAIIKYLSRHIKSLSVLLILDRSSVGGSV